jgi:hypothetical protein
VLEVVRLQQALGFFQLLCNVNLHSNCTDPSDGFSSTPHAAACTSLGSQIADAFPGSFPHIFNMYWLRVLVDGLNVAVYLCRGFETPPVIESAYLVFNFVNVRYNNVPVCAA